jgi:protein arginine kinase activator
MKCTECGEREGVVNLTQIVDGEVRTGSLCAKCAAEKGLDSGTGLVDTPLGGFLAALGDGIDRDAPLATALEARCPGCGATLRDFRETGRVGCAECYTEFDPPLRELLRRLHGSTHHTGRRFAANAEVSTGGAGPSALDLRERLRRAIEGEQFEIAAELRDQLRERE